MNHPDSAPDARRKFWWRVVWASVAAVIIPPLLGLSGTVIGMLQAFSTLRQGGQADPNALAGDISFAILTTLWGMVFSLISLLILIAAIIRLNTLPKPAPTRSPQASLEPPT